MPVSFDDVVTPNGSFGIVEANSAKGGLHVVANNTARDAISSARRIDGMEVNVLSPAKRFRLTGGVSNVNWVEVTGGASIGCTAVVDLAGNDAAASIGGRAFLTFAAALDAVQAANPSASNPLAIKLCPGVHAFPTTKTILSPQITIKGEGLRSTKLDFTGAAQLIVGASNIEISECALVRSGGSSSAVLTTNTTSIPTYKNLRLDRVILRNDSTIANSMAGGTLSGEAHDCEFYGKIAVDWGYGFRAYSSIIHAHDPLLVGSRCITVQSIAPVGGYPVFDTEERYISQRGGLFNCFIINTDPDGVGVNGIRENEVGVRDALDWHLVGGVPSVSWYPVPLVGCYLIGAELEVPHATSQHLIPHTAAGTGGLLRGTLRILNCEVYGFYLASYLNNSDVQGGMWATSRGDYQAMKMVQANSFTGVSFISGDNRVGYIDELIRFGLETGNVFSGCHFQGETGFLFEGNQYQTQGCTEISFRDSEITHGQKRRIFGWEAKEPQAIRLNGAGESYLRTVPDMAIAGKVTINSGTAAVVGVGTAFLTDFAANDAIKIQNEIRSVSSVTNNTNLILTSNQTVTATAVIAYKQRSSFSVGLAGARTFELWFRCDDDGGDSRLFTFDGDSLTTSTVLSVLPSTGQLYGYAGGVLVGNQSGLGFGGVGIGNSVWHHVAMVVTAGLVGTIYLDGVPITGSAGSVANVTGLGSFRIGVTNNGLSLFKGDIIQIRISNVARYTADFSATLRTIAQGYIIDANTISQWGNSTRKSLGWTDEMGLHDLEFGAFPTTNVYSAPNLPYWVLRDRSLVWEHAIIP